jgi:hypothetical protein
MDLGLLVGPPNHPNNGIAGVGGFLEQFSPDSDRGLTIDTAAPHFVDGARIGE